MSRSKLSTWRWYTMPNHRLVGRLYHKPHYEIRKSYDDWFVTRIWNSQVNVIYTYKRNGKSLRNKTITYVGKVEIKYVVDHGFASCDVIILKRNCITLCASFGRDSYIRIIVPGRYPIEIYAPYQSKLINCKLEHEFWNNLPIMISDEFWSFEYL